MTFRPRLATLLSLCLLATACGSALSDEEILRANGVGQTSSEVDSGPSDLATAPVDGTETTPQNGAEATTTTSGATAPGPTTPSPSGNTAPAPEEGQATSIGTPGETGPIIIGSVGNYSGPAGAAQVGVPRAVQVWAASINANGGLFGREVRVIVQDDGGDPARYAAAVQDLVENRGVIAFVGQAAVLSVKGGMRYLAEKGIPVIGTDCAAPEWWEPSTNNFPQCADAFGQSITYMSAGFRISGTTRLGYVYCGESPACTANAPLYENESGRAGGETVYRDQISIAQIDFTANCQAAQRAQVELMTVLADPGTLARFVRSCDRQGFKPQYLALSISALRDTVKLPGLSQLVLGVPTFPFAGASSPAIDQFHRAMERHLDGEPGPAESVGWTSAKLFELAATRAAEASGSLNPQSLIAAMRTVKGETLGGLTVPLDFRTERPTTPPCAFVMQGDGNGGWQAPYGAEMQCIPGT